MELITHKSAKYFRALIILFILGVILLSLLFAALFSYAKILGAPPLAISQSTLYFSDDGNLIGESSNGEKRYWRTLKEISPHLVNATVAVEDRQFFDHNGFDYKRIGGAILADIKAMAKVQGASTITQQYARNLFLEHDKTWTRKLTEAFYTVRLEMNYSKEEILEGYLNTINYGHGAYGAEAASQYYFGKEASELTLAEASILAGIPKGPSNYSPINNFAKSKQRQAIVLRAMEREGYIGEPAIAQTSQVSLHLKGKHRSAAITMAPYFQDEVKKALRNKLKLDERTIALGGLKVYTTLNEKTQKAAEEAFDQIISDSSEIQGALIAMKPKTGEVQALVGGRDYRLSPFNRATQAVRQPGSTIKPLLYYAALEHGFTPSTTLKSEPTSFSYDEGTSSYKPHNFNHLYANAEITLAQAIAVSDNVYAVKTHMFLGEDVLGKTAERFGLNTSVAHVPSAALGTSIVKPIEIVNAYNLLANGGKEVHPVFISKVVNHKGEILFEQKQENNQVLEPRQTLVMNHMLTGVFDKKLNGYTKVTGNSILKSLSRPYAGKSGTTPTDSWMIGYTPQLTAGVWTGYDTPKNIVIPEEKQYAKKIWAEFMEESLKSEPVMQFKETDEVTGFHVDPGNGKLATENCPVTRLTYFVNGSEPTEYCQDHLPEEKAKSHDHTPKKMPWYKRVFFFWK